VFNISKIQNEIDEGDSRIPINNSLMIMSKAIHNSLSTLAMLHIIVFNTSKLSLPPLENFSVEIGKGYS